MKKIAVLVFLVTIASGATVGSCRLRDVTAPDGGAADGGHRTVFHAAILTDAAPIPYLSPCVLSGPFTQVRNWDFGTEGNITDNTDLIANFTFHDNFNTIANGTNYGAVVVAPTDAQAIAVSPLLNQPGNVQPVENPGNPTRIYTPTTMIMNVMPLFDAATCTPAQHNIGCGSFYAIGILDAGGQFLGQDVIWETRIRMNAPTLYYWFATWTDGNLWNQGAEIDTPETFGTDADFPPAQFFHVDAVQPTPINDRVLYKPGWQNGMLQAGIPNGELDLTQFHIWTFLYQANNAYSVWVDNYLVQNGSVIWTEGATEDSGPPINMTFLFDCTWGNVSVSSVNPDTGVPAANVSYSCEIDYSRIWLRP
jgi:hypothetical protein